jgi:hypothetical protein
MFLHSLYTKGMSYSSLNTARSAIYNLGLTPEASQSYVPIGRHLLVCRYLKGVFNELKPVPKYHATVRGRLTLSLITCLLYGL